MDKKKPEGQEQQRAVAEKKLFTAIELQDILTETETALGNIEIITRTMKQQAVDGFEGVENDAVRHAYYKLADLAEEALKSLGWAHDTLNTAYKAA